MSSQTDRFIAARDQLLQWRDEPMRAVQEFRWPSFDQFNWVRDYFDVVARENHNVALRVVTGKGPEYSLTFAENRHHGATRRPVRRARTGGDRAHRCWRCAARLAHLR